MGGFEMDADHLKDIRLVDIVVAIDGNGIYHSCILGLVECDAKKPCALHSRVFEIRKDLRTMLEQTTMFNLIDDIEKGFAFLKH